MRRQSDLGAPKKPYSGPDEGQRFVLRHRENAFKSRDTVSKNTRNLKMCTKLEHPLDAGELRTVDRRLI
jgi:hypothetical protein